jgi:hypothetical protein
MDAALKTMESGGTPDELAKAIKNLGKHGSRAADVLKVPGKTNVAALEHLAERLMEYKKLYESGQLVKDLAKAEELARYRGELQGLLGQLRTDTAEAIRILDGQVKAANLPAAEIAKFQDWVRWQATMTQLTERAADGSVGYVRMLETAIQTAREGGADEEAQQSVLPIAPPAASVP